MQSQSIHKTNCKDSTPCCVGLANFYVDQQANQVVADAVQTALDRYFQGAYGPVGDTTFAEVQLRVNLAITALFEVGGAVSDVYDQLAALSCECKSPCCVAAANALTGLETNYNNSVTTTIANPFLPLESVDSLSVTYVLGNLIGDINAVPYVPGGTFALGLERVLALVDCDCGCVAPPPPQSALPAKSNIKELKRSNIVVAKIAANKLGQC